MTNLSRFEAYCVTTMEHVRRGGLSDSNQDNARMSELMGRTYARQDHNDACDQDDGMRLILDSSEYPSVKPLDWRIKSTSQIFRNADYDRLIEKWNSKGIKNYDQTSA